MFLVLVLSGAFTERFVLFLVHLLLAASRACPAGCRLILMALALPSDLSVSGGAIKLAVGRQDQLAGLEKPLKGSAGLALCQASPSSQRAGCLAHRRTGLIDAQQRSDVDNPLIGIEASECTKQRGRKAAEPGEPVAHRTHSASM